MPDAVATHCLDLYRLAARVQDHADCVRDLGAQVVVLGDLTWRGTAAQAFRVSLAQRHADLGRLADRVETVAADVHTLAALVAGLPGEESRSGPCVGPAVGP